MESQNRYSLKATEIFKSISSEIELVVLDSCSSTSSILLEQELRNNFFFDINKPVKVLVTKHQTGGRGRYNSHWQDYGNSILFSIAWQNSLVKKLPLWSSLAWGMVIVDCLQKFGFTNIKLKWPNDIYYIHHNNYSKLGGILFERKKNLAVLGLGINVLPIADDQIKTFSSKFTKAAISLIEIKPNKQNIDISSILSSLITDINNNFWTLTEEKTDFSKYYQRWQQLDLLNYLVNNKVIIHRHHQKLSGIYKGVNQDGGLMLAVGEHINNIYSGRVEIC